MHYTSGTTGSPKGVRRALTGLDPDEAAELAHGAAAVLRRSPTGPPNVHLITSPNYHTAVTVFGGSALHMGHTLVVHGQVGRRGGAGADRALPGDQHAHGADAVQADAVAARADAQPLRPVLDAVADPRRRAVPESGSSRRCWTGGGRASTSTTRRPRAAARSPPRQDWLAQPGTVGHAWPISEVMIADDDGERVPDRRRPAPST